ncbi:MAG: 2-oxoacid:acceptor oxidoreductase family protein [Deltaproteobacteria bacterium]|nr:2-oxoacid:acceptor oxidoreductase family protein [Deltaproteobacteria bacterium]
MSRDEIKLGGFGGQGVILSGIIVGKAAALYDNKEATLTQAFGPEARGSACSAQVVVSSERILYPYVTKPNIMVLMSQDAYNRFSKEVAPGGTLIIEEELVKPQTVPEGAQVYKIPATRIAEELGKKLVVNIVMVGFFAAITNIVDPQAIRKAVEDSVPKSTIDVNLKAFDRGFDYGKALTRA